MAPSPGNGITVGGEGAYLRGLCDMENAALADLLIKSQDVITRTRRYDRRPLVKPGQEVLAD